MPYLKSELSRKEQIVRLKDEIARLTKRIADTSLDPGFARSLMGIRDRLQNALKILEKE